jgi:transcriptional regulator with XRE-family HTH domain
MQSDYRNIYQDARRTAGLTQERGAELLGISVDAVRQYETDRILPSDEVVLRMAEAAGQQIICYWHLIHKSRVAAQLLPELDRKRLPEAVLSLLVAVQHFQDDGMRELTRIAADGKISQEEQADYMTAMEQLQSVVREALHLQFAEEE